MMAAWKSWAVNGHGQLSAHPASVKQAAVADRKNWAPTVSAMSATCLAIVAVATVSVAANEFVREREKTLNMRIASVESDVREF